MEPRTTSRVTRKVAPSAPTGKIHDTKAAWCLLRRACAENDTAAGLLAKLAPPTWTDHEGRTWQTPRTRNALNATRSAGHRALKNHVLRRDGERCAWCKSSDYLDVDHVVSLRCGGAHHPANLRALCRSCNATKGAVVDARREAVA